MAACTHPDWTCNAVYERKCGAKDCSLVVYYHASSQRRTWQTGIHYLVSLLRVRSVRLEGHARPVLRKQRSRCNIAATVACVGKGQGSQSS